MASCRRDNRVWVTFETLVLINAVGSCIRRRDLGSGFTGAMPTYRYESARAKSQTDFLSVESASIFVLSNCRGVTDTPPFRTTAVSEGSRVLLAPLRMLSQ